MNRRNLVWAAAGLGAYLAFRKMSSRSRSAAEVELWSRSFPTPEGGTLEMRSLRGQTLIVNFWASWCGPCVAEMPSLSRFHEQHRSAGWGVLGLAAQDMKSREEFLARRPVSFPVGVVGNIGLSRGLGKEKGTIPFTVVLDRFGEVLDHRRGMLKSGDLERWASQFTP